MTSGLSVQMGMDYPHLTWEYVRNGDFACPDGHGTDDLARLAN